MQKCALWSETAESLNANGAQLNLVFHLAWHNSLLTYKGELTTISNAYFSSIINLNRNNPKFLFDTVKSLTQEQTQTVGSSIVAAEFMVFFENKIQWIRAEIDACRAKGW